TASIGIVIDKDRSSTPDGLMRAADVAMYLAKDRGKGRYELFHEAAHARAFERLEMKAALSDAVRTGDLVLHYQPIVELTTGAIAGCEALVRWNHPERGLISPAEFIPLAEDSGLIVPLGNWVLRQALARQVGWRDDPELAPHLTMVSVNVSSRQFHQADFVEQVESALAETGANPRMLELEVTESLLLVDVDETVA